MEEHLQSVAWRGMVTKFANYAARLKHPEIADPAELHSVYKGGELAVAFVGKGHHTLRSGKWFVNIICDIDPMFNKRRTRRVDLMPPEEQSSGDFLYTVTVGERPASDL